MFLKPIKLTKLFIIMASLAWEAADLALDPFYKDADELLESSSSKNRFTERLVISLDGIPYELVSELWNQGYFSDFHRPSRLIAPFPAMTDVSLRHMFGMSPPKGYESLYFDRFENRFKGGASRYFTPAKKRDYKPLVDYQEPVPFEFLVYLFPDKIEAWDFRRFLSHYFKSSERQMIAVLKSTDGLVHLRGREGAVGFLRKLDRALTTIYQQREGRIEILVFSDHGNSFAKAKRLDLARHLKDNGYDVAKEIKKRTVVIPAFGLASFAAVYATSEDTEAVSRILAGIKGVDFVVYKRGGSTYVRNRHGLATISYDPDRNSYKYTAVSADPLEIAPLIEGLSRKDAIADGYIPDAELFEVLKSHKYPDALHRIYRSMNGMTENDADILVSVADGYFCGSEFFSEIVTLRAVHGSCRDSSSYAFIMSTSRRLPEYLRYDQVQQYIRLE